MRFEVAIVGSGGQGVILAGSVVGLAAIKAGLEAIQTSYYGPESRGGYSRADVVLSHEPIDYPGITGADLVMALSQHGYDVSLGLVKSGGSLFFDSSQILRLGSIRGSEIDLLSIPASRLSEAIAGSRLYANMISLGFAFGKLKVLREEHFYSALSELSSKQHLDRNLRALAYGFRLAGKESGARAHEGNREVG